MAQNGQIPVKSFHIVRHFLPPGNAPEFTNDNVGFKKFSLKTGAVSNAAGRERLTRVGRVGERRGGEKGGGREGESRRGEGGERKVGEGGREGR